MAEPFPRWASPATLPLAAAGLAVSGYLTWVHYTEPTALSCPDTGAFDCLKVTTSPQSMLFGRFPVALAGVLFFVTMVALTLPPAWRSASPLVRRARLGGGSAGVAMVVYLVYAEALLIRAVCLWCTVVHALAFLLFVAVLAGTLLRPLDPTGDDVRTERPSAAAARPRLR